MNEGVIGMRLEHVQVVDGLATLEKFDGQLHVRPDSR